MIKCPLPVFWLRVGRLNGRVPEACLRPKEIAVHSVGGIGLLSFFVISKVKEPQYAFTFDNVLHVHYCSQSLYLETMLSKHSNGGTVTLA